jgi:hypothetical protein
MKRGKIIRLPFDLLWMRFDTRKCVVVELYWLGIYIGLLLFSINVRSPLLYRLVSGLLRLRWNYKNIIHRKFGLSNLIKRRSYRRGFISWTALPIFLFMAASIAIAVYSYKHLEEIGGLVAIVIISIAAIVAMWNAENLSKLWQYRPWNLGLSKVLLVAVIVALLGCTMAAYSDVEPFSAAKTNIISWFSKTGEAVGGWFQEKPVSEVETEVLQLVNVERANRNIPELQWDEQLHQIAREHSQAMADIGSMFHSSVSAPYAENCYWSGGTTYNTSARDIVTSWMGSDKHRTWLLCPNLKHIGVGLVKSDKGLWASWTFWRSETAYSDWWYSDGGTPPSWWY